MGSESSQGPQGPPQMVLSTCPYFPWHPACSRGLAIVLGHAALSWADGQLLEIKASATPPSSQGSQPGAGHTAGAGKRGQSREPKGYSAWLGCL